SLHQLPIIFACENNLYSVYSHLRVRQPSHREVYQQAIGHGVRAEQLDGNDPLTVHGATARAVLHARNGEGPTFLEMLTYRWREHCGPNYNNQLGYRMPDEVAEWSEKDPLATFERRL